VNNKMNDCWEYSAK